MAHAKRNNFHGGYDIHGLEQDIANAQKNAQFNADMSRIGGQMSDDIIAGTARTTAGIAVGGVAVGVGMVRNRRFRYIVQALLHFPMAFFVPFFLLLVNSTTKNEGVTEAVSDDVGGILLTSLVVCIVWTGLYIALRTVPKLRKLNRY